jgi:biotin transporter BioY
MSVLVPLLGTFVAGLAAAGVYVDAGRRGLPTRTRNRWTAGVGATSLAGFLAAWLFDGVVVRLYLRAVRPDPVVYHPREPLAVTLVAGLVVAVLAVVVYRAGSRRPAPAT